MFHAIQNIELNECYLSHFNEYRHVSIYDIDELILPRQIKNLSTFESVQSAISNRDSIQLDEAKCDENIRIEEFIDRVLPPLPNRTSQDTSFYFKQGAFLTNSVVDLFFAALKSRLESMNLLEGKPVPDQLFNIEIQVIDQANASQFKFDQPLSFSIRNSQELDYALGLLRLYERTVKPFLDSNRAWLERQVGETFSKLFHVSGEDGLLYLGKSVHSTRHTAEVWPHHATSYLNVDPDGHSVEIVRGPPQPFRLAADCVPISMSQPDGQWPRACVEVPRQLTHLSHFRDEWPSRHHTGRVVSISDLHFDLNYFRCFVQPMVARSTERPPI
jgi:hypothetical protein